MELGKIAAGTADLAASRAGAEAVLPLPPPGAGETGSEAAAATTALADEVTIHPLDVAGALQILIAEVRESFTLSGDYPARAGSTSAQLPTAATVPLLLVQMLLQRQPEEASQEPAVWLATATQAEAALRSGMDKAVDAVAAWRSVPASVLDVIKDARAVVLAAVVDDPPNPLWLRPEWLGLAPRMQRFWRRRRHARRYLRDPDVYSQMPEPYDSPDERGS